ncbi:hypothetical protein ACFL1Z_06745 [Thermodesulfobacteriota bacterium]
MKILLVKPKWFVHGGQYRYLEKARAMFQGMDLQWDLDELHKITVAS